MYLYYFGETVRLSLQLEDGATSKYPKAYVYRNGVLETTVDLNHVALGRYYGNWVPSLSSVYDVVYVVYSDIPRTIEDRSYSHEMDTWKAVNILSGTIADYTWDELLSGHTLVGSAGEVLGRLPVNPASARERVVQGYAHNAVLNVLTGVLWFEKDGQLITAVTSCTVDFFNDSGTSLFTISDISPDSQGIFKVSKSNPGFLPDQIVYARASITIPGPRVITTVKSITAVS